MRSRGLKPNHLKALELLANNELSIPEVAKSCKMSPEHLYGLIEGKASCGPISQEFHEEFNKVIDEISKRTEVRTKQLRDMIVQKMSLWAESILLKPSKIDLHTQKRVVDLLNALTKAAPTYNIGAVSYSKGLSGEDLLNEFRRLSALAKSSLDGRGIPGSREGGEGLLPPPTREGNPT